MRWLTGSPSDFVADIEQYIEDAKSGRVRIHYSTIALAEIKPSSLKAKHRGSVIRLFTDLGSAFYPIDPNANIMIAAGRLKDSPSANPGDPKIASDKSRVIGTGDAIQLATCIYARDVLELSDILFQTFDDGKSRGWEGKCVPILSFERWFPENVRTRSVTDVCSLKREMPRHPSPDLATIGQISPIEPSGRRH